MADLIAPGIGSIANALVKALSVCIEMMEGQESCIRLHTRLTDVLSELQKIEAENQMPPSEAFHKYVQVVASYHAYLQKYRGKSLVKRLIKHHEMLEALQAIQQDVTTLFSILHLAAAGTMVKWKRQWEIDQRKQKDALAAAADNGTKVENRLLRPWYLPLDEIKFEPIEFDCGSFSTVHRGICGSGASVVVKCLIIGKSHMDECAVKHIKKGMGLWYGLTHPNMIQMFGASHVSFPPFIVCEDASNGNLRSFLSRSGNMRKVWRLLHQAALRLEYMHKNGIVHGDLKLNNILVGADGVAKLSDFGLSAVRTCSAMSRENSNPPKVSVTLCWRAPECLRCRPTFLSDIYSFAMCIIETFEGHPPFLYLDDDDSVRDALKSSEIPDHPGNLEDGAWELVVAMTVRDPKQRLQLNDVIKKLNKFANVEIMTECVRRVEVIVDSEVESPTTRDLSLTVCKGCSASVPSDSMFCGYYGVCLKAITRAASQSRSELIDCTTSVESLMRVITNGRCELKARALRLLVRKCIIKQERKALYSTDNIQALSDIVRSDTTYFSHLYALGSLSWAPSDNASLSRSDLKALPHHIRDPSQVELDSVEHILKHGTAKEIDDKFVIWSCFGTLSGMRSDSEFDGRIVRSIAEMLEHGSTTQTIWATVSLRKLAYDNNVNLLCISRNGVVPSLVKLVRTGTEEQKHTATWALANLSCNDASKVSIGREGATSPLVKLVETGNDWPKEMAALALFHLAQNYDANRILIACEGAISSFVTLVKIGNLSQKTQAVITLSQFAHIDSIVAQIVREGGIPPLVNLVEIGTEDQKGEMAGVLAALVEKSNSETIEAMRRADIATSLQPMVSSSSQIGRDTAAFVLAKARDIR